MYLKLRALPEYQMSTLVMFLTIELVILHKRTSSIYVNLRTLLEYVYIADISYNYYENLS